MTNQNQYLFTKVSQQFARAAIDDIGQTVRDQFEPHATRFPKGARIAIAVGSRGVANIATIARAVVECVKAAGCEPFANTIERPSGENDAEPTNIPFGRWLICRRPVPFG